MFGNEEIEIISAELKLNYPSISNEDAVRLAFTLLSNCESVNQLAIAKLCERIWFDYNKEFKN